ncbi:MAG: tetratricopeptide repeat protein [Verrucomicrobiota bacterium]
MIWRLFIVGLVLPLAAQAEDTAISLVKTGIVEFTAAYDAWDAAQFAQAAGTFAQACAKQPGAGTNYYWKGVAEFHRLLQLHGAPESPTNRVQTTVALKTVLDTLTTAVKLDGCNAENHALLGTVYGMSIAENPLRAMWLGPRVMNEQEKSLQFGATNPRVQYLLGMSHYHAPKMWGGKTEALACLLKAEKLFTAEAEQPAGPVAPRWGRSNCLAFIGKTYDALGKPVEAEQYFRKALAVNPHDKLAREELEKRKK